MSDPAVIVPGAGRHLDLGNFEAVVLADGRNNGESFSLLQTQNESPGFGPPLHIHHDAAEAFYVLEGEYAMFIPTGEHRCPPGSFVYVPRGVPHTFQVVSKTPGKKLNLFVPQAMVSFFERLAEAEAQGEVTPEMLDVISAENHMEVVGPVPNSYL